MNVRALKERVWIEGSEGGGIIGGRESWLREKRRAKGRAMKLPLREILGREKRFLEAGANVRSGRSATCTQSDGKNSAGDSPVGRCCIKREMGKGGNIVRMRSGNFNQGN